MFFEDTPYRIQLLLLHPSEGNNFWSIHILSTSLKYILVDEIGISCEPSFKLSRAFDTHGFHSFRRWRSSSHCLSHKQFLQRKLLQIDRNNSSVSTNYLWVKAATTSFGFYSREHLVKAGYIQHKNKSTLNHKADIVSQIRKVHIHVWYLTKHLRHIWFSR